MRSAIAFLPPCMMTFMNLASSTLPYLGSGRISRLGTSRRRGISTLQFASAGPRRTQGAIRLPAYSTRHWVTTLTQPARLNEHRQTTNGWLGLLRALGAVLGTGLLAILHALQVQGTANDVVTHTGQVLDTTAANQHHAVFLQVVAFAADVGDDFEAVGQAHLGDLTQSGVGLFRRRGVHTGAHTAALRRILHRRALGLDLFDLAPLTD